MARTIRRKVGSVSEAEQFCIANDLEFVRCVYGRGDNANQLILVARDNKVMPVEGTRRKKTGLQR